MGLLDFLGEGPNDPRFGASLALAQGLTGRRGIGALLDGLQAYQGTMAASKKAALEEEYRRSMIAEQASQIEQRKAAIEEAKRSALAAQTLAQQKREFLANPFVPLGAAPGSPSIMQGSGQRTPDQNAAVMAAANSPGQFDMRRAIDLWGAEHAAKVRDGIAPRPEFAANEGVVWDKNTGKVVGELPQRFDANKPFNVVNGQVVANSPFQAYSIQHAQASSAKNDIRLNTTRTLAEDLAAGMGQQINNTYGQARAAVDAVQNAHLLRSAVESGRVINGPGADWRVTGLQLAKVMGVAGKNADETLTATRQAMQNLAKAELAGAEAMRGQGTITDTERDIIKRASAGDINKMTDTEMLLLADAMEKTARARIASHRRNVDALRQMPGLESLGKMFDMYNITEPGAYQPGAGVPTWVPGPNGWVKK